ncbi:uncharacterized protein LOC144167126 [Haemaphysalis longicornis]
MRACFPFCPILLRSQPNDENRPVSPGPYSTRRNEGKKSGSFLLTQFSRDLNRRRVDFVPPVPALSHCSLCGLVPPRLYTSTSCPHVLCSHCLDNAQPNCPFDGLAWRPATINSETLHLVSKASVYCWNRSSGCSYVGCLLDMPGHYGKCPYYVTCCGVCGQNVRMKDLAVHARRSCNSAKTFAVAEVHAICNGH